MAGDQPGPAPQVIMAGGRAVAADPVTDLAAFSVPPDSPGGRMLEGPRAQAFTPRLAAAVRPVVQLPPPPGTPGRLVKLPGGRMGVSQFSLPAMAQHTARAPVTGPNLDPPLGAQVIQSMPDGTIVVSPLPPGYQGADDAGVINTALLQCASNRVGPDGISVTGGRVKLSPGIFNCKSTVSADYVAPIYLQGAGTGATVLSFSGTGDAVSMSNPYKPAGGSTTVKVWGGGISDLTIDGTNAGPGSAGLHTGDMKFGRVLNVQIQNFTGAGSIGLWLDNRYYWTEDCIYDVHALNCTTHFQVDCTGALGVGTATFAHDNCWYQLSMAGKAGQNGMYVTNGANLYHSRIWYHGGIDSSSSVTTNYYLKLDSGTSGSGSQMNRCEIVMEMESDGGLANNPITIITAASNTVQDGWGRIAFLNTPQTAQLTGGFSFSGPISGDSVLAGNIPSLVPANGTPTTNAKNPAFMCVSGGTVSAIKINGVTTGLTSGVFLIPVNNTYEIDYTVAPTVNWIPAVPA